MADQSPNPFHGLFDMFAELNRMREQWTQVEPTPQGRSEATAWIPGVDIFARGADIVIRCELAGVPREDVEVSFSDQQLSIAGERTGPPEEEADIRYYVRERRYGPFRRTINLPDGADRDKITATVADGLLEIVIGGCVASPDERRIEVTGADGGEVRLDVGRSA